MKHKSAIIRIVILISTQAVLAGVMSGCMLEGSQRQKQLNVGIWRGVLSIQGQQLPFTFEVTKPEAKSYVIHFINGDERIPVNEINLWGDSVFISMHIFDTEIKARILNDRLQGVWQKRYAPGYIIPFQAAYGQTTRFATRSAPRVDISGKWRVDFSEDSLDAVGIFQQDGSQLTGTFLTSKGDYRYLEGGVTGDTLYMSTFDGEHAFLFSGTVGDDQKIRGEFHSGPSWYETWTAERDEQAQLADADSLTFLKPGFEKLQFSFPDLNGRTVTLEDEKYQNKIVILQIFGTWCPNCMDETKFLSSWYRNNRYKPVEVIGLAYERLDDYTYSKQRLNKMILHLDASYDFLVAGSSDKVLAGETLPMLNHIMSFPTTIFIDHRGTVRRIHTGFTGPGTGAYYHEFVDDFNLFVDKLVAEKVADTTQVDL